MIDPRGEDRHTNTAGGAPCSDTAPAIGPTAATTGPNDLVAQ